MQRKTPQKEKNEKNLFLQVLEMTTLLTVQSGTLQSILGGKGDQQKHDLLVVFSKSLLKTAFRKARSPFRPTFKGKLDILRCFVLMMTFFVLV